MVVPPEPRRTMSRALLARSGRGAATLGCALCLTVTSPGAALQSPIPSQAPPSVDALLQELHEPYADLFRASVTVRFPAATIGQARLALQQTRDQCLQRFKARAKGLERAQQAAQDRLRREGARLSDSDRHDLHCEIQNLRIARSQADVIVQHAIPTAYENREAKLDLIEKWPAEYRATRQMLASGAHRTRRRADVEDIGFREIARDQEKDIRDGEDAIKQLRLSGLLPKELDDDGVRRYVTDLAQRIAARSDVRVPLHVTVLDSKEINAFALPGGFLFVERGLLDTADDEAQLAGVVAHELAHVAARHAHKLMQRDTIASIFYQAAQIAAVILTGGTVGAGLYYALQYGFYGLGLAIDLKLLGVSREFELEADQLGLQYAWHAGYDTTGFVRFFDKVATRVGYVNGISWFHSHPPFYERMRQIERELAFLPARPSPVVTTPEFAAMKQAIARAGARAAEEEATRPSLVAPEQGCPAPLPEYRPDQPIDTLCPLVRTPASSAPPSPSCCS